MNQYISFITQDLRHGFAVIFFCLTAIAVVCLMDLWTGIDAARANKERIRSRPLRRTGTKMLDYYRIFIIFVLIDFIGLIFPWYNLPYAAVVCTLAVIIIEGVSMIENFKKKKSNAAKVHLVAGKIVECTTKKEALEIVKIIKENGKELAEFLEKAQKELEEKEAKAANP